MSASKIASIGMTMAAAAIWYVMGIGPFVLWLLLAAVAAPIVGKAISSDEYFDTDIDGID